jgi:hypothetical protein
VPAEFCLRLQCKARRPATHGRPEDQLGHGLAARSSHVGGPHAHAVARAPGALAHGHRTRDGAVAWLSRGQWWLAGGKVLPASSWGPLGGTGQQERRRGSPRAVVDCEVVWRRAVVSSPEGGSVVTPASSWSCEGGRER